MTRRKLVAALGAMLLIAYGTFPAKAVINEALSFALEAASPFVKKGFSVREDNWQGKLSVGKKKAVKYQLFKGNEYWFWLGTSFPDCELTVEIFDDEGNAVGLETFSKDSTAGVRVNPAKTGTYFLRVTVKSKADEKTVDWALVYGYR